MRDGDKPEKISCILRQDVYNDMVYYGLVAQLGERSVRIREVEGSNPFRSTMKADLFRQVCFSYALMQTFVLSFAPPLHAACNCWNCSKETLNSTSSV